MKPLKSEKIMHIKSIHFFPFFCPTITVSWKEESIKLAMEKVDFRQSWCLLDCIGKWLNFVFVFTLLFMEKLFLNLMNTRSKRMDFVEITSAFTIIFFGTSFLMKVYLTFNFISINNFCLLLFMPVFPI